MMEADTSGLCSAEQSTQHADGLEVENEGNEGIKF